MLRLPQYRPPSPDDGASWATEQRWLIAEAEIARHIAYAAIGIVASLVATFVTANYGQTEWARVFCICCFGAIGRVIFLIIKRHRVFIDIKMAGGMTKHEAILEKIFREGS